MPIEWDSVHFRILERLCKAPRAVRGISPAMLERHFDALWAVEELAADGLIQARGWTSSGPGAVWVPTEAGETLYRELAGGGEENGSLKNPASSDRHPRTPPGPR
ncbi:MAG: hypothetical protein ACREH6_11710 [Geminicoccaceae bacterium]